MDLRQLLAERRFPMDAAALIARKDKATISRIAAGKSRARPETVVALARAFGMSARRMQAICDESWAAAHPDETLPGRQAVSA
jgi:plasmid maintenance system antidote protein VapI